MKPMNYMELLGDLPEDLVDCAFLTADSGKQQAQNGQAIRHQKGEYTMEKSRTEKAKPAPFRIGRAGIAAAVALCIGLNAALIYGIGRMKSSGSITPGAAVSAETEPEMQEITDDSDRTETVPDVIGTEYEKARDTLQKTGFLVDKRSAHNPEFPAGTVISIDPKPGTELAFGSYVRVTVSLGKHQDTGTAPNFIGMDWEKAKQTAKESGIQPIKFLMDSDEYPAGTVAAQGIVYNTSDSGSFIVLYVAKEDGEQSIAMKFTSSWCQPDKDYYYYLRNEAGEIIGATLPFSMIGTGGSTTDFLYPDCSEENTKATAVLVDLETKRETNIGSYILHPETATYEILSEDIEAAFNALNG